MGFKKNLKLLQESVFNQPWKIIWLTIQSPRYLSVGSLQGVNQASRSEWDCLRYKGMICYADLVWLDRWTPHVSSMFLSSRKTFWTWIKNERSVWIWQEFRSDRWTTEEVRKPHSCHSNDTHVRCRFVNVRKLWRLQKNCFGANILIQFYALTRLGPDTDTLKEILQELGKRHIKYNGMSFVLSSEHLDVLLEFAYTYPCFF